MGSAVALPPLSAEQLYWLIEARKTARAYEYEGFQYRPVCDFFILTDGRTIMVDHQKGIVRC